MSNNDDFFHLERLDRIRLQLATMKSYSQMGRQRVLALTALVKDISEAGLMSRAVLLGQIVSERSYAPTVGGSSSGQIFQSALLVPGGIGLLIWDADEFCTLEKQIEGLESAAERFFVPFETCEGGLQGLLATQYPALVEQFLDAYEQTQRRAAS